MRQSGFLPGRHKPPPWWIQFVMAGAPGRVVSMRNPRMRPCLEIGSLRMDPVKTRPSCGSVDPNSDVWRHGKKAI